MIGNFWELKVQPVERCGDHFGLWSCNSVLEVYSATQFAGVYGYNSIGGRDWSFNVRFVKIYPRLLYFLTWS